MSLLHGDSLHPVILRKNKPFVHAKPPACCGRPTRPAICAAYFRSRCQVRSSSESEAQYISTRQSTCRVSLIRGVKTRLRLELVGSVGSGLVLELGLG